MVSLMVQMLVMKTSEKVMHGLVLGIGSCQVTVRGVKEFLCDSPLLLRVGAVTEPSVEIQTP